MSELDPQLPDNKKPDDEPLVQYEDLEQATGFTQISNAVLRCYPELSDGEKMTYAVLKSFAYVGPETFVGEETLARARDITVSTVSRHLSRLIEVGLVRVRRRGQGKTNIWIINRIPREKLERYIDDWRPKLKRRQQLNQDSQTKTSQNPQTKTSQNSQTKASRNPQAEEQESEEHSNKNTNRSSRSDSTSTGNELADTAGLSETKRPYVLLPGIVENFIGDKTAFSTVVESVDSLAELAADYFEVPEQVGSITSYLEQYDADVVADALETVARRLAHGEPIEKPVAYFYTVVKVMQAEKDARIEEQSHGDRERLMIARNWARSLSREWPLDQVRAILADTYRSPAFVDRVMQGLT